MKKTLTFKAIIDAPKEVVWEAMLGADSYTQWTAPFCEGGYFTGTWEEGSRMEFLAPNGDGMVAEIAAVRPHEFVSIRHLGEIRDGVEDTASESVKAWAPVYENYSFEETADAATELTVDLDTLQEYEDYMLSAYPKALAVLKEICEAKKA